MSPASLLSHLESLGVHLRLQGDKLLLNAPKGAITADLKDAIARLKPELMDLLRIPSASDGAPAIASASLDGPLPLSFAQERIWFLEQIDRAEGVYNIPVAARVNGPLDVHRLEESIRQIVARHTVLRANFHSQHGRPMAILSSAWQFKLTIAEIPDLPTEKRQAEVERIARDEAVLPFDLARDPLIRGRVLSLGPDEHLLLLTFHHTVCDGWSLGVFLQELAHFYTAGLEAKACLTELAIQYPDYARWQREYLSGNRLQAELNHWRKALDGATTPLELPTDRPRPPAQTFAGAVHRVELDAALVDAMEQLGRDEGCTLFMVLLAAFSAVLGRYSHQQDVVIGTPIAGRTRAEFEKLIGLFVNTLGLRVDLSGRPTFRELLARARQAALDAYAHQDVPFEKLVEALQPRRDLSRSPLFQVMLILQNAPVPELRLGSATLKLLPDAGQTAKFDLTLELEQQGGGTVASWNYNRDLFDAATIERMAGCFETFVRAAIAGPDRPIDALPLLSPTERGSVLRDLNRTHRDYGRRACMHELFRHSVAAHPDATALVFAGESISYAELAARANRLARYLRSLGVAPETLVGVCMERTPDLVVALLAVLKAGGAYVPLDIAYPAERLEFILEDAQAPVVLTTGALAGRLGRYAGHVVCVDQIRHDLKQLSPEPIETVAGPTNLAYIIYTSGSTGRPKGVAIEHRSAFELIQWAREVYSDAELNGVLASTSICFDLSVFELFVTLSWGGRVILVPNVLALRELDETVNVTLVNTVPSAAAELVRLGALPPSIQTVNLAGEPLSSKLVDQIYTSSRVKRVYDLYGPSEDTTYSTFTMRVANGRATIGKPISNTRVYILDENLQPVPLGATGEIYIAGAGLARGYLRRPDLTAERFIPDPWSSDFGARMYRTGDLGRYLLDGNIVYLGRSDYQVKIRGFRIELGEIESAIESCSAVRAAVVSVVEHNNDKRLVGYYVGQDGRDVAESDLRAYLAARLPAYMIPTALIKLSAMPMTPNGKIDRKALPAWNPGSADLTGAGRDFVSPRTLAEQTLAGIWQEVLGVSQIGALDDFFESGGHSLLATQVVARVRDAFNVELPIHAVFEQPTLERLARTIEEATTQEAATSAKLIVPLDRRGRDELSLSFGQQRLWFLEQLDPGTSLYNVPVGVRLEGPLDVDALTGAINHVIARHESLRTVFAAGDGEGAQRVLPELIIDIPVADISYCAADVREKLIRERAEQEANRPFNLMAGPLIRGVLLRVSPLDHVLLLTMHHIICDGWSVGVLLRETAEAYSALRTRRAPTLANLPIQYADYAHWQRSGLTGETLATQIAYWRDQLGNNPPVLNLPTDRPRPAEQTYDGATLNFAISPSTVAQLETISRRENATLFMTLFTTFATLLSRHAGQDEFVIGSPIAGRRDARTEDLIGFFVNTLALRVDLTGSPTFRESLARVRQTTLQAYAHQDVPFEKLVDELQPRRDMSRPPIFQVVFALQNMPLPVLDLDGVKLTPLPEAGTTAKFDLMLTLQPSDQGLTASLNYNRDLFDRATIQRMADRFVTLLVAVIKHGDDPVSSLGLLPDSERALLASWSQTATDYPRAKSVHELFEEQVRAWPNAIAVDCAGQTLTYRDLNDRTNAWAEQLLRAGVRAETPVGLCVERSVEMVVGLLAILKTGGAYVPLDPTFPQDRLRFILSDTGAKIVLTQRRFAAVLPNIGQSVLFLDDTVPAASKQISCSVSADGLAYVMYTSGSTGTPKGVAVTHRGIVRLVRDTNYAQFDREQVFLQLAPLSFDASTLEMWGPLLNGGRLIIMPPGTPSPEELGSALREHGVTTLWLTAGLFHRIVDHDVSLLDSVRQLLAGGDVLSVPNVQRVLERRGDGVLINGYGPTECTTFTCCNPMREPADVGSSVSIGRPIANTRVYICDASMQQVPIGVPGELYVSGDGLARGYVNEPRLTAERFVPNPFAQAPGERLYRTGDLVRWLVDGRIEFLGRTDFQVKIRGFRVEPGEVEAALADHPDVCEAVVVARADVDSGKRLVAYVLPRARCELPVTQLRHFLQQRMPDYMVPSAFVSMETFPLNANGKVDRAALPAPECERPALGTDFVAPANWIETELARIWSQVLRVEQVGSADNFFELGGDSILSLQVVSRAQRAGIRITTKQIFQHQTVGELAVVAQMSESTGALDHSEIGAVPLLPAQRWFLEQDLPDPHHWNQSVLLKVRADVNPAALDQAFRALVTRHDSLRLRFNCENGAWSQNIVPADNALGLERIDLAAVAASDLPAIIERHATRVQASLDLTHGPIVRMAWFDAGEMQPGRLLIVIHHLAVDGVSWRVLLEDLQSAYAQATLGRDIKLPAPAVSIRRWGRRLDEQAQSDSVRGEVDYWLALPDRFEVPLDMSSGSNLEASAQRVSAELTAVQTESLLREVPRAYHTHIDEVLLAALARTVAHWTAHELVCLELEGHGREVFADELDLSRTVGWLTSMYPVALSITTGTGPAELLCSVKEQLRAVANRGAGYSVLRYLAEEPIRTKLRAKPCPQIRFNYLGQFDQVLAAGDSAADSLILGPADESTGAEHSPNAPRSHLIEINALIAGGRLRMDWVYSTESHRAETIERLARDYIDNLCEIIRHCESPQAGGYTPSDFPLAGLDQDQLAKLANLLGGQS